MDTAGLNEQFLVPPNPTEKIQKSRQGAEPALSASSSLLALPGPVKQDLHIPQAPQHCCQCSMPCPSVQLLRPWGTPALVPAQDSSSPTFLLEKGWYNLTKFISALTPILFSQNAALYLTSPKPWDYGQELKVFLSSFFQ